MSARESGAIALLWLHCGGDGALQLADAACSSAVATVVPPSEPLPPTPPSHPCSPHRASSLPPSPAAQEDLLLASLWVLESSWDAARSPATLALNVWVQPLCLVSRAAAERLVHCGSWAVAFASLRAWLVAAQLALLERLAWRVALHFGRDVQPCHTLLFWPASWPAQPSSADAAALKLVGGMRELCAGIVRQVRAGRRLAWSALADGALGTNCKRKAQLTCAPLPAGPSAIRRLQSHQARLLLDVAPSPPQLHPYRR